MNTSLPSSITINVTYPRTNVNVTQNVFFNVSVNVSCYTSNCGEINVSLDPEEPIKNLETRENFATIQYKAKINEPVKWKKQIKLEEQADSLKVGLPEQATNISVEKIEYNQNTGITGKVIIEQSKGSTSYFFRKIFATITGRAITEEQKETNIVIKDNATEYEIQYETPAPKSIEKEISRTEKRIIISASDELNYTNVLAYTKLSKEVPAETINLYHVTKKGREKVKVDKKDTNNNKLIDYIEWNVEHLSEQTYELVIEIITAEHLDEYKSFI